MNYGRVTAVNSAAVPEAGRPVSWLATYRRLWSLLLSEPGQLFLALGCMAAGAAATGGFALLTGPAVRLLFTGGAPASGGAGRFEAFLQSLPPGQARAFLPLALLLLTLARAGCSYVQADRMGTLTLRAVAELQEGLHGKLLSLPISYFQGRHTGELFSRFGNDLGEVQRALGQGLASGLRDVLQIAALVIVSAFLDVRLLLLAALAVPATIWPIARFARALRRISSEAQAMQARQVAAAQEALSSAAVLHAYGAEEAALRAYGHGEETLISVQRRSFALRAAFTPTIELLAVVALALVLLAVALNPSSLPPEKLLSFLGAVLLTYQPLKSLANSSQWIVPGLTAAERIFAVIDAVPAVADRLSARTLGRAAGALRFEGVSVRYGDKSALSDLELSVRAGERVGIVGPSGAGKTTLLHLVPRLLDPSVRSFASRRNGRPRRHPGLAAQAGRAGGAGPLSLRRFGGGERRGGRTGRVHLEDRRGPGGGGGAGVREAAAAGVADETRRARRLALRRTAPAAGHRPGAAQGRAHPDARRGDQRP